VLVKTTDDGVVATSTQFHYHVVRTDRLQSRCSSRRDGHGLGPSMGWVGLGRIFQHMCWVGLGWIE